MKALINLAARSAWNRRGTLSLVLLSVALSTLLLLTLERLRTDARASFSQSVSGTDLIVGARTGAVPLMLYSVFHIGGASNSVHMASLNDIAAMRAVSWLVPLSLGDSHRGFAVLGTTPGYFEHFHYGERRPLVLAQGRPFSGDLDGLFEAVLGADVADALGYKLGQRITLSHGNGPEIESEAEHDGEQGKERAHHGHDDKPFTVVGILARTGTPVDRTVHVSLQAIEAVHLDWVGGAPLPGARIPAEQARKFDLAPKEASAALVGLRSRAAAFAVQRQIASYAAEPLMAVLPGVALDELWGLVGIGERVLMLMSGLVALVSLAGLVAVVLAGLNERRRELALLRAVGAGPREVLFLLAAEGSLVTGLGALFGTLASLLLVALAGPWMQARFGITLQPGALTAGQWRLLAGVLTAGITASLVPGWRAYRLSLADGLSPRT
jgi:putative ABC transport system permease protein